MTTIKDEISPQDIIDKDEVLKMAKQAGAIPIHGKPKDLALVEVEKIEHFAKLVASAAIAKEREACAKIVESNADSCRSDGVAQMYLYSNATAIRARSISRGTEA